MLYLNWWTLTFFYLKSCFLNGWPWNSMFDFYRGELKTNIQITLFSRYRPNSQMLWIQWCLHFHKLNAMPFKMQNTMAVICFQNQQAEHTRGSSIAFLRLYHIYVYRLYILIITECTFKLFGICFWSSRSAIRISWLFRIFILVSLWRHCVPLTQQFLSSYTHPPLDFLFWECPLLGNLFATHFFTFLNCIICYILQTKKNNKKCSNMFN